MTTVEPLIGTTRQQRPTPRAGRPRGSWRTSPGRVVGLIFLWGDLVAVVAAAVLSGIAPVWGAATAVLLITANATAKLYRRRLSLSWGRDTPRGRAAAAAALGLLAVAAVTIAAAPGPLHALVRCVGLAVLLLGVLRMVVLLLAHWARRHGVRERILVAGTGPIGMSLVAAATAT